MRLSICSSVYHSEAYLNINKRLINLCGVRYEWLVVNNTVGDRLTNEQLDQEFKIIDGVPRETIVLADGCTSIGQLHHGLSLNKCLSNVDDPDYILMLDPDFYMFRPINDILKHMEENDLAIFGSPYMSKTPLIYDFPVAFNMFIDVQKIPLDCMDFTPGYGRYPSSHYPDCGYKVYSEYRNSKYEATLPSEPNGAIYNHTTRSLADYGIEYDNTPNSKGTKIDEYFWNDKPYAVHLRSKLNQGKNFNVNRVDSQLNTLRHIDRTLRKGLYGPH